jgi:hypothetical protein
MKKDPFHLFPHPTQTKHIQTRLHSAKRDQFERGELSGTTP